MIKVEDLVSAIKSGDDQRQKNTLLWVLAVLGAVAAIAGIAYAVYRYMTPEYLEDYDEDFDDDFDDFFEDDDFVDEDFSQAEEETGADESKDTEA